MLNEKNFREAFEPLHASDATVKEVLKMTEKKETRRNGWVLRTALAAALVACLMMSMTVALAGVNGPGDQAVVYEPFQPGVFESEEELLNALWGLNGKYDLVEEYLVTYGEGGEYPKTEYHPGWERGALDPEAAQAVAPLVTYVGKSMEWNGYTFTADHLVYDEITGVGALVYTMEFDRGMPEFESYYPNGSFFNEYISFDGVVSTSQIVPDKTTDDLLVGYFTFYYMDPPESIKITFSWNAEAGLSHMENIDQMQQIVDENTQNVVVDEEDPWWAPITVWGPIYSAWRDSFEESDASIVIDLASPREPDCLHIDTEAGEIRITPMGMFSPIAGADTQGTESVVIRYADGTEYAVYVNPPYQHATLYGVQRNFHEGTNPEVGYAFLFNRLVDLDEVVSVVISGTEYFVE